MFDEDDRSGQPYNCVVILVKIDHCLRYYYNVCSESDSWQTCIDLYSKFTMLFENSRVVICVMSVVPYDAIVSIYFHFFVSGTDPISLLIFFFLPVVSTSSKKPKAPFLQTGLG